MTEHIEANTQPPTLLDEILRTVPRRYRLPALSKLSLSTENEHPATDVAITIESARESAAHGATVDEAVKLGFLNALAQMIRDAMLDERGDPVFQAMLLQHQSAQVREYASLSGQADHDRRALRTLVNAVAHPAKQQRASSDRQAGALEQLHALALSCGYKEFVDTAQRILQLPEIANEPAVAAGVKRILDSAALKRLGRLGALETSTLVQHYQWLRNQSGPRAGSSEATIRGTDSKRRGAAVEALAARALQALAQYLEKTESTKDSYRIATSLQVPAALAQNVERAKSEWDVVLLKKAARGEAGSQDATAVWDVCLLIEAKASADAATTDLPRLRRGLQLLAQADDHIVYSFKTGQETVRLSGSSLSALKADNAGLEKSVLYCSDAPAEPTPRLLSPASRMQLLSTQASLDFAAALSENQPVDPCFLEPVWHQLLMSPRWKSVLHQYATLHQARSLMIHPQDLLTAIERSSKGGAAN